MFDSFENPAQRVFIPDSSRQFASNFFIPNLGATGSLTGNGQASVLSLINKGIYNSSLLTNGLQNLNQLNFGFNSYWFMLKMYNRLSGDQEFGTSFQTKAEGRGSVTDETLLLLDNYENFANGKSNNNLFNDHLQAQAYHQFSLTYRQKVSPNVTFGIKLSALLGLYYTKFNVTHSSFNVDTNSTQATLALIGNYTVSNVGKFGKRDFIGYKNPGMALSFGLQAQLENGILLQGNIKDLGFIRWNKSAVIYNFSGTQNIDRITTTTKNDSRILTEADSIISNVGSQHAFYAPINGKADLSISKKINLITEDFYYSPTFIISKELFYSGLIAALVNHFTYQNLWFTVLASYNNERVWNAGLQLMYKAPNAEFYLGTEQLFQSPRFFNATNTNNYPSSGINAYLGFSLKFGRLIERPANASYIPMGDERGFFNKLWAHIFKRSYY